MTTRPFGIPFVFALAATAVLGACHRGPSGDGQPQAAETSTAHRYTVRGEVVQLPDRSGQLMLRHEPIDDFVDHSGAVVGMDAMTMPFSVARTASLDGLAVGDKVEAVIAVDFSHPTMQIEQLRRLPPDTALRTGKARARAAQRP